MASTLRALQPNDEDRALLEEFASLRMRLIRLQRIREFALQRSKLTSRERLALDVLSDQPQLTMGELGIQCNCTKSTMTAVVDRLVRRGYVERESPEWDRRSVHVRITSTGREVVDEHRRSHHIESKEMLMSLNKRDQRILVRAYRGLVDKMEAEFAHGELARVGPSNTDSDPIIL